MVRSINFLLLLNCQASIYSRIVIHVTFYEIISISVFWYHAKHLNTSSSWEINEIYRKHNDFESPTAQDGIFIILSEIVFLRSY